ncbi:MAG: hypothetical protein Kow0099_19450 [Candidatus Abyssubacteria bacterium]
MFRAILWKEWRELWMLPAIAAPLAVVGVLLALILERYELSGWDLSFGICLPAAAVFIPVALLARKEERESPGFLALRPLDRFRLWWMKLIVAIALFALVGGTLYVVTRSLGGLLDAIYNDANEGRLVRNMVRLSVLLFCLSSLASGLFKRLTIALMAILLSPFIAIVALWIFVYVIAYSILGVSVFSDIGLRDLMPLCPLLLFCSLFAFARDNLFRRTRPRMALAYGFSAVLAAYLSATISAGSFFPVRNWQLRETISDSYVQTKRMLADLDVSDSYAQTKRMLADWFRPSEQQHAEKQRSAHAASSILDVSRDGNRLLLGEVSITDILLSVDLAERTIHDIHKGVVSNVAFDPTGNKIVYLAIEGRYSSRWRVMMSDTDGTRKTQLCEQDVGFSGFMWSPDGNFAAVVGNSKPPQIIMFNSEGELLGNLELSVLEPEAAIDPVGWDAHVMFYYFRYFEKREDRVTTSWRIRPEDMTPVPTILPPSVRWSDNTSSLLSPDGRWLANHHYQSRILTVWRLGTGETIDLRSVSPGFDWSHDGTRLAFMETTPEMSRIVVLNPDTEETVSVQLQGSPESLRIIPRRSWSPSDRYLLLWGRKPYALSVETGQMRQFPQLPSHRVPYTRWISGDRLAYESEDRLSAAEVGGAAWKEIFRIENGEFIFDGNDSGD